RPDYCDAIRSIRKPVIAAVNGYAFGGGFELAMSADIRLASRTATFAAPEIKLGWIGGGGVSAFLANSVGPSNAALMLYTGDPVDAATALSWGLVSRVLEPRELLSAARELAGRIGQRPPIAAQTAKLNLRAACSVPLESAIQYERDLQIICFATEDAAEGRRAFAQKRTPRFHGREDATLRRGGAGSSSRPAGSWRGWRRHDQHADDFEPKAGDPLDEPGERGLVGHLGAQGGRVRARGDLAVVELRAQRAVCLAGES